MASLVDSRPNSSSTPPILSPSPSYFVRNPGTHSPPIKTTTNTLPPAPQSQPQMATSIPTTPGLDIPGAFPREKNTTSPETSGPGPAPRQSSPETRGARSLLPRGHSYANTATLPSTEKEGVKPGEHYDGVGPLPGSISETSVAKLPDERLQQPAGERDQSVRQPAAEAGAVSLPSQETQGALPGEHQGGAGALPGSGDEAAVAKLPDERAGATSEERSGAAAGARSQEPVSVSDTSASPENKAPAPSYALGGAGDAAAQVQGMDQEPLSAPPKAAEGEDQGADVKKTPADSKFKEEVATEEKKSRPEGKDEPKAESHRAPAEEPTSSSKQQEGTRATVPLAPASAASGARVRRKGRSSSDSDASNHKKASVMNKVKGEMMALLGKASRNKERVEAGEKLKHGSD